VEMLDGFLGLVTSPNRRSPWLKTLYSGQSFTFSVLIWRFSGKLQLVEMLDGLLGLVTSPNCRSAWLKTSYPGEYSTFFVLIWKILLIYNGAAKKWLWHKIQSLLNRRRVNIFSVMFWILWKFGWILICVI